MPARQSGESAAIGTGENQGQPERRMCRRGGEAGKGVGRTSDPGVQATSGEQACTKHSVTIQAEEKRGRS